MFEPKEILDMRDWLYQRGIKPETGYSYTQYMKREEGVTFNLRDHIKAMILSLLSANRPWKQIEENISKLDEVFNQYDVEYLISEEPKVLMDKVCALGCGNKAIMKQMQGLSGNVSLLESIDNLVGLERLVVNNEPYDVSLVLSSGYYKLNGFAQTLALQYLRNVGIDTCKPDVHIRRILDRLGVTPYEDCPVGNVLSSMKKLSFELNMSITLINEIIWMYGATGYGEVCTKSPKCNLCVCTTCHTRRM